MNDEKQVDIRATYRELHRSPGHVVYGIWVNGGKSGDLTVRVSEENSFLRHLERGGFDVVNRGRE